MISPSAEAFQFDSIDDVLRDIAAGKMVIVTDDADRENEGDLIMAAEKATPPAINFMTMHGRGLICVPISAERADQLGLQRMVAQNREMYRTDFTVSVDAAKGITTGISAHDRAATIRTIARPKSEPNDLVQPGILEAETDRLIGSLGRETVSPGPRSETPADLDGGGEVRFPWDSREPGEPDECSGVPSLEGPQPEASRIESGFELLDECNALVPRQRRREVLHDAWIGVHRRERRTIVITPVA